MLVNKLKEIAETLGFPFNYGDYNWQNLSDFVSNEDSGQDEMPVYFLLLWKDADKTFNEFNELDSTLYSGEFLLVVRSGFNGSDYNEKYENRISYIEGKSGLVSAAISDCEGFTIKKWKEIEVQNQFDTNVDGLKIQFAIKTDE